MLFLMELLQSLNEVNMRNQVIVILTIIVLVVSCREDVNVNLGREYKLITSASMNDLAIVGRDNVVAVHGHVLDYAFDSTFIIVAQRPRDSVPECNGKIPGMTLKKSQEAFEKSNFSQYWIIDKTKDFRFDEMTKTFSNVYGPFKNQEYIFKRNKLNVPTELELKKEISRQ